MQVDGAVHRVDYNPGESMSDLFGGNSNWRGPIWMPVNYLLIESLQKFHYYFGDEFKVECPVGSGTMMTLWEVAAEISRRLAAIFRRDPDTGRRAVFGPYQKFQEDPAWNPFPFFHEYFHADEAGDAARVTRPGGRDSLPSCCNKPANTISSTVERGRPTKRYVLRRRH